MTTYNTEVERRCLTVISSNFPCYRVINPSNIPLNKKWGFDACMKHLLPLVKGSDLVCYYKDESYSPGVDMEIAEAVKCGIPVRKVEL